jgi:hypothetical protein
VVEAAGHDDGADRLASLGCRLTMVGDEVVHGEA